MSPQTLTDLNLSGVLAEMASNKSDRSMSPSTLSEEGRRELIARQHRALYGNEGGAYLPQGSFGDESAGRDQAGNIPTSVAGGVRGPSPRGIDPFGMSGQGAPGDSAASASMAGQDGSSRAEKAGSPSGQNTGSGFGNFDGSAQPSGKVPSPPASEEVAHSRQMSKSTTAPLSSGMGPIGSRPNNQQGPGPSLNKRTTSPLPTSLSYGFGGSEQNNDRAASSNSNSNNNGQKESNSNAGMGAWGTGSGVWGSNKIGTTSVWG